MKSSALASKAVLVVGVGGLGCPAALVLCRAGFGRVILMDDDEVDETNLHRQILYSDDQVGMRKLTAAKRSLMASGVREEQIELLGSRLLPETAMDAIATVDVVIEGADNYATKFLAADACFLSRTGVVHGAAVGWRATVMAVAPQGRPCYRCLFEDLPDGSNHPNCDTAGVMGPVVGIAGAALAEFAIRTAVGEPVGGEVVSYDGKLDSFRQHRVGPRPGCALCGADRTIHQLREERYLGAACSV